MSMEVILFQIVLLVYGIHGSYVFLKVTDSCLNWNMTDDITCDSDTSIHCILNEQYAQGMICARVQLIQKGYCPYYRTNNQLIDARACNASQGKCPKSPYLSYTAHRYSACYFNQSTAKPPKSTTSSIGNQLLFTPTVGNDKEQTSITGPGFSGQLDGCDWLQSIVLGVLVLLAFLASILIVVLISRGKRRCIWVTSLYPRKSLKSRGRRNKGNDNPTEDAADTTMIDIT